MKRKYLFFGAGRSKEWIFTRENENEIVSFSYEPAKKRKEGRFYVEDRNEKYALILGCLGKRKRKKIWKTEMQRIFPLLQFHLSFINITFTLSIPLRIFIGRVTTCTLHGWHSYAICLPNQAPSVHEYRPKREKKKGCRLFGVARWQEAWQRANINIKEKVEWATKEKYKKKKRGRPIMDGKEATDY